MIIEKPFDAEDLPDGSLWVHIHGRSLQVTLTTVQAIRAARIIIAHNDKTDFISKAHLMTHAGKEYGFGFGNDYTYSPKEVIKVSSISREDKQG